MNGELRFGLLCLNCVNRFVCGIGKGEFAIRSMVQHFPQPAAMNVLVKHSATHEVEHCFMGAVCKGVKVARWCVCRERKNTPLDGVSTTSS